MKAFQGFVNGTFCRWNTRVIKEFPTEWQITRIAGSLTTIRVKGFIPIPLLAFICFATVVEQ